MLEYLSSHDLDPCNLYVGSIPSELVLEKLFVLFKSSERVGREGKGEDGILGEENNREKKDPEDCEPRNIITERELVQLLIRWSSIGDSPSRVVEEVNSLLSLLSPSIACLSGRYVAIDVSSFHQNRYVGDGLFCILGLFV